MTPTVLIDAVVSQTMVLVAALATNAALERLVQAGSIRTDIGGSTFTIDLWEGHAMEGGVLEALKHLHEARMDLRQRIKDYIDAHERPEGTRSLRVISYVGQTVKEEPNHEP